MKYIRKIGNVRIILSLNNSRFGDYLVCLFLTLRFDTLMNLTKKSKLKI